MVKWEKGEENIADYLSRHPTPWKRLSKEIQDESIELEKTIWYLQYSPFTEAISIEKLLRESTKDPVLQKLRAALEAG